MRVLCLTPALSMRTYRQMKALADRGHEVTLLYMGKGGSVELTDVSKGFKRIEQIKTVRHPLNQFMTSLFPSHYRDLILKETGDGGHDVVHTCSMPDILAASATRYSKVPNVYDVRDMVTAFEMDIQLGNYLPRWSLRIPPVRWVGKRTIYERLISLEKEATLHSDARIYVSDHTMELSRRRYGVPERGSLLFYNFAMREDIRSPLEKLSDLDEKLHLVYEGVLSIDGYRGRMLSLFKEIARKGIHIHIHGMGDERSLKAFKDPEKGIDTYHFEGKLPHEELMSTLTRYDAGLIPFQPYDRDQGYMDTMLPNKLFDYLVAGLPLIVPPTRSISQFIARTGTGFTYELVDDLPSLVDVRSIKIDRNLFVIEEHISELEDLYRSII
jgi:hypothetical protein